MARKKIALIGAGNIGGSMAHLCLLKGLGDVVLFDVIEGLPQGKALDLSHAGPVEGFDGNVIGTNRYDDIAGADVCIVTAGIARELNVSVNSVAAMVLGGHGDDMVPIRSTCLVGGMPVEKLIPTKRLDEIEARVRNAGGEVVALLKTGSAYFSPASAAIRMAEAYLFDKKEILPCAAMLEGEYGVNGYYFCVPVIIGAGGVEKIIDINLSANDKKAFDESLNHVKDTVQAMNRVLGVS